ncbi:hypothetical protein [Oceanithermus sp.]
MRKWMAAGLLVALLAACNLTITLPSSVIVVDGSAVSAGPIDEGQSARFSFLVGASPVRLDVTDLTNGAAGSLRLRVYDANDVLYAQTVSRYYFTAPYPEVVSVGVGALGITASPVYSINLPAGFGRGTLEVTNLDANPTSVQVAAVSRAALPYSAGDVERPQSFSATSAGALLYLGQTDAWEYQGSSGATLELLGGEIVHATAKVKRGLDTLVRLEPGEQFVGLEPGDIVYVQAQGNGALAGFCNTLADCADGTTSGEYTLSVTP